MVSASELPDGEPASKKSRIGTEEKSVCQPEEDPEQRKYDELMEAVNRGEHPLWINPKPDKDYSEEKDPEICEKRLKEVKDMFERMGEEPVVCPYFTSYGNCVAAAIFKGFIKITGDPKELDMIVWAGFGGDECSHLIYVKLRELLDQPDCDNVLDGEDPCQGATVLCTHKFTEEELKEDRDFREENGLDSSDDEDKSTCKGKTFVSKICTGDPEFDNGYYSNHAHCPGCANFGKCFPDTRTAHCEDCGEHYYVGLMGGVCDCTRPPGDVYREMIKDMHHDLITEEEVEMLYEGMKERGELTKSFMKMKEEHWEKQSCAACMRFVEMLEKMAKRQSQVPSRNQGK